MGLTTNPRYDKETEMPERWLILIDNYFANGFNAFQAAVDAGYSPNSHNNSWRIFNDPRVKKEVAKRFKESAMGADEILARLAQQGRSAYAQYITEDGEIDVKQMVEDGNAWLIKEITYDKYGNRVYKFNDPQTALQLLGKHLKLFTTRQEITGKDGGAIQFETVDLSPEEEKRRLEARLRLLEKMIEQQDE